MLRVAMKGALNTDTAPGFEEALSDAVQENWQLLVLDMKELDYISSAGLRVIFKAAKQQKGEGRSLAVANRQPQIEKVFEILQALPDMAVFANDAELDDYLDAMQAKVKGG
ncbi:MAG: STAS domain-containing protein [Pseudomonadota bacterium]